MKQILFILSLMLSLISCQKDNNSINITNDSVLLKNHCNLTFDTIISYKNDSAYVHFNLSLKNNVQDSLFWLVPSNFKGTGSFYVTINKDTTLKFLLIDKKTKKFDTVHYTILFDTIKTATKYDFRNNVIGKYSCKVVEHYNIHNDTSFIPTPGLKEYFDTISVTSISNFDISINKFFQYNLVLRPDYSYSDDFVGMGLQCHGLFKNDSIYFYLWSVPDGNTEIKGKKI